MQSILDVIKYTNNGQVAKATFADETWYVVNCHGQLRYSDEQGDSVMDLVTLSYSNLQASYEILS